MALPFLAVRRPAGAKLRAFWLGAFAALAVLCGMLSESMPSQAQSLSGEGQVQEGRDEILRSGDYQTDRPEPPDPRKFEEPMRLPPWVVEAFLWTIAAILVVMVAVFLFNALQNRTGLKLKRKQSRQTREVIETPLAPPQQELVDRTLAEADALAAEGRFAEAIHLLLLVAMDRLRRELGAKAAPALTGREILKLPAIPQVAVDPLTRMVSLSEIKHFGGRDAAAPDYDQCRLDFLRFSGQEAATA